MQIRILPEDVLAAAKLHEMPRPSLFVAGWVLLILYVPAALWGVVMIARGSAEWHHWLGVGAGLYFLLWVGLFVPWKLKRLYRQQKQLHEPFEFALSPTGLSFRTTNGEGTLPWSHVHKWRESAKLFLLYQSEALYSAIPKRDVDPNVVADIRAALAQHVGPADNYFKQKPLRDAS